MKFCLKPPNDFPEFIETYFRRCQAACPKLSASAGKWQFEDLIPGLSDFDTRFIAADDTTAEDWAKMSLTVGKIHTELTREEPRWARILEHLPGVNLTLSEVLDPVFYYPEFQQWTFYHGEIQILSRMRKLLAQKAWNRRDEIFHFKKFAAYYGPYQRGIDPPVNLAQWENKYLLHSRFMHYFTPAVQSAVSLVRRQGMAGKLDSLREARRLFPHPDLIDLVLDAVDRHYEVPEYYLAPKLSEIERRLESYLQAVYVTLAEHVTLIQVDPTDTPQIVKSKVAAIPMDVAERFYEGVRYCRFMKGRLLFYAEQIPWFETTWLIRNEMGRILKHFYLQPLTTYGMVRFGEPLSPDTVIDCLQGEVLSAEDCDGLRVFARVASAPVSGGEEKNWARQMAEIFDPVALSMEKLKVDLRCRIEWQPQGD